MMTNDLAAAAALDNLPIGSQVAAAYIDDADDTATIVLFERRDQADADGRHWWDLTRGLAWWSALDIARAHDDMVITAKPEPATALADPTEFDALAEWKIGEARAGILFAGRTTYHCVNCGCVMFGTRFHDTHRAVCPGLENRS